MEEFILRDSVQAPIKNESDLAVTEAEGKSSSSDPAMSLIDEKLKAELNAIPDKMGFKIGEVADMLGIKSYVLRYWETEFETLKPKKSSNNQRMYARRDVETAYLIKKLLYRDRYSIEGARKAIKSLKGEIREDRKWDQVADRYGRAIADLESLIDSVRAAKTHFR